MSFSEVSKLSETFNTTDKGKFDIDKRADISQVNKSPTTNAFDIDKRAEFRDNHRTQVEANYFNSDGLDAKEVIKNYILDIKANSEYPDTIKDEHFINAHMEKITPEENSRMREEFDDTKASLKKQWEKIHGIQWPKYDHDIYSSSGKLIRCVGTDYDAHHIQPLGLGGKNISENITPLSAENHYDKQGVHSFGSPYDKLCREFGG